MWYQQQYPLSNSPLSQVVDSVATDATKSVQFKEVYDLLQQKYVGGDLDQSALIQGAIRGMVAAVDDPYTVYFSASEAKEFQEQIDGSFEGVGMEIGLKDNRLVVISPLDDSPAMKAGVRAGDIILGIDQQSTDGLTIEDGVSRIRGASGTSVTLTMQRGTETLNVTVKRAKIVLEIVKGRVVEKDGKKLAVIQLTSFNQTAGSIFRTMAQKYLAERVDGFILDLRGNPGGFLDQAINVASAFIGNGTIVSEVGRDGKKHNLTATGSPILSGQRVVVLVNQGSASASEIVAGALQDTDTATVIGTKTFGKGSVQEVETVSGGATVKITVAKWFTPAGRSIQDQGITPDQVVERTAADETANRDPQLDAAVAHLLKP